VGNTKNGGAVYVHNGNTLWTEYPNTKDGGLGADDDHATHFTCQD
jgi:hypothetical protein